MNAKRWVLLMATVTALGGSVVRVASAQSDAELFQKSYDSEAVGKLPEALAALDKLPADRQSAYVTQLRRGWLLYKLGRSADAIEPYNKAIALEPGGVEARVGVLLPLMALRRWADAETHAREVLKRDPGNYLATIRFAFTVYSLGRYGEAEGAYKRVLELYPSDVDARAGLGWSLVKLGKLADAAREFRAVLAIAPRNALALDGMKATGASN
jgi:tetratricopeptide (TPR) repeat protein